EQHRPRHGRGRHGRAGAPGRGRGRVSAAVPAPALPRPAPGPGGLHHRRRLRHRLPHRRDLHEVREPLPWDQPLLRSIFPLLPSSLPPSSLLSPHFPPLHSLLFSFPHCFPRRGTRPWQSRHVQPRAAEPSGRLRGPGPASPRPAGLEQQQFLQGAPELIPGCCWGARPVSPAPSPQARLPHRHCQQEPAAGGRGLEEAGGSHRAAVPAPVHGRAAAADHRAAAVDEALQEFQRIDILINGAAGNFLCPASALSFNAFKTVIDIDTMGTFNTSKVLFEKYFRDHGGVIINITATLSYRGQALQVHAGAAKAAIDAMTRHLAVEWGPNNIRVNSLAPGPISGTEGFRRLGGKFAEKSNQFSVIPLQRAGNKTEIAHSALYLASPLSSYVTGTTLVVDGGSWLTSPNSFSALLGIASSSAKL
uniref:Peroxisomal 2,4-dienoyl-CoA reductase [(3E)-enoyl-CoA-producing] n=1 Tax=Geospiza parvula TaxID=87175 RepID=A0A8C3QCJ2_GEOPR